MSENEGFPKSYNLAKRLGLSFLLLLGLNAFSECQKKSLNITSLEQSTLDSQIVKKNISSYLVPHNIIWYGPNAKVVTAVSPARDQSPWYKLRRQDKIVIGDKRMRELGLNPEKYIPMHLDELNNNK
ncbi:hypothetical protein ISS08_01210 [Candidatus Pacearchaeota archaeon]|nr:hypothetical protein [Candidatus Pacearchaeota archaeon]